MTIITNSHLIDFSKDGLRTLCIAQRPISLYEYEQWDEKYERALISLNGREAQIHETFDEIEQELELVGATGVDDKLQIGVTETIELLRQAGIKVWVLTGDKLETAVNIAFASKLFVDHTNLITIKANLKEELNSLMINAIDLLKKNFDLKRPIKKDFGIVVDGATLAVIFDSPILSQLFLEASFKCTSVLCCRVSAKQKAQVLLLVKVKNNATCLAIGDGANDVRY